MSSEIAINYFQNLPNEMINCIFDKCDKKTLFSLRATDKSSQIIIDEKMKQLYGKLQEACGEQKNAPSDFWQIIAEELKTLESSSNSAITKIDRIMQTFVDLEITSPDFIPFQLNDFKRLEKKVNTIYEEALEKCWSQKVVYIFQDKDKPSPCAPAAVIRNFLNLNIDKLKGRNLHLNNINLKVIPHEIFKIENLKGLNLCDNRLVSVPPQIGNLGSLENLSFAHNKIKTLTPNIGNLLKLKRLFLSENDLKMLPDEICKLSELHALFIPDNKVTHLPQEIGKLNRLASIYISGNPLTTLPKFQNECHVVNLSFAMDPTLNDPSSKPIKKIQKERISIPVTPLAELYKRVICDELKEKDAKKIAVNALHEKDKDLLYEMVWASSGAPTPFNPLWWGEQNIFKVKSHIFDLAVQRTIIEKYQRLDENGKNEVGNTIWQLADEPETPDHLEWGKKHALDNLIYLANMVGAQKLILPLAPDLQFGTNGI